ncbi:MAG: ABC transporter ATP-binding protein, partial [Devosia sp.]
MRPGRIPETLPFEKGQRLKTLRNLGRLFLEMWSTNRGLMSGTIVLRLIVAVQPPLALLFTKFIIDEVVRQTGLGPLESNWLETGRLQHLGLLLLGEFALVFSRDLLQRGIQVLDALQGELHSNRVSVDLMRHAAELDLMHFEEASYQDKLERARRQAASRSTVLGQVFGQVQMVITAIALSIGLAIYAPLLIVLMAIAVLPAVYGEFRFNRLAYWLSHERSPERRQMEYLRQIGASADSAKEVKLFGLGGYLVGKFRVLADAIFIENRKLTIQRSAWGALLGALSTIAYYGAFAYVVWRTLNGEFTIGDLVFLSGSFSQLNGYFQQILIGFTQIAGQALYLDDLYSFFDIKPTITEPANPKPFPMPLKHGIVFDNVGFRYPGSERFVIRNLSLTINAGETVALVGENGAGKTTVVKLMTRLYEAEEGRITIDGTDIRDFSSGDLRRNIGVIFQDFLRYSFTARDNIGVGRIEEAADLPRITRSAE